MMQNIKKSVVSVLLGASIMCGGMCVSAADISVYVDSKYTQLTDVNGNVVEPFIQNGTTYVPLRGVSQALGCSVDWDENNKTIYIYSQSAPNGKLNRNTGDDIKVYIDGEEKELTDVNGTVVKPFIIEGTTYVPVRGVSTALGYYINWNGNNRSIEIYKSTIPKEGLTLDWVRPYEMFGVDAYYESAGQSLDMDSKSYSNSLRFGVILVASDKFGFNSTALFNLDAKYEYMTFTIGHCVGGFKGYTSFEDEKTMEFIVDGKIVKSYTIMPNAYPEKITVPLNSGLQLKVISSGDTAMGDIIFY